MLSKISVSAITTDNDIKNLITNYENSIKITEEDRNALVARGELEPVSSKLGIDREIKRNHLLQIAMRDPKAYISARTEILKNIKDYANQEYQKVYDEYTKDGINKLPPSEARRLALLQAKNKVDIEMMRLEAIYPSEFGGVAYQNEINKQLAQKNIDFSTPDKKE